MSEPSSNLASAGRIPEPSWHGIDLSSFEEPQDPYPIWNGLRETAPVNLTPMGFWRLTRYVDIARVLRDLPAGVRTTDGRLPAMGDETERPAEFMLEQDPPNHTRLRNLVSKAFTPRSTEKWRPRARRLVSDLLDDVESRGDGSIDVIADLALPVPSTLICEMLGVPTEDRGMFTEWTADATHGLSGERAPADLRQRAETAMLSLAGYFSELIERRRGSLSDDLLSQLIRAEEQGDRLSPTELLVQAIGLLIAGFETTIGLIGNGVRQLILHPAELAKLRANPDLVGPAVEECLRFDGPISMTVRVLHEPADFDGFTIPRDAELWLVLASANRDPARFPDPERFWIERPDNAHLSFGGGAHLCLGHHLARMEAQEAIGGLVRRFPELALDSQTVEWGRSLFRVPARLPVHWA